MPGEFSIELAARNVVDVRTRDYFDEVYRSYSAGNYRSAVVMLWSVVVADLWFKVVELSDTYQEPTAVSIRDEIIGKQAANPKSPEWETSLLDAVRERTELINGAQYSVLSSLRDQRHYCAHPVLDQVDALFLPTPDQVRAFMREALETVLTQPAVMTRKIFDALLEDLEEKQTLLPDKKSLQSFLETKYFARLGPAAELSVFRSLWRVVFTSADARCEANRAVNLRALSLLFARNPARFERAIAEDAGYFSDVGLDGTRAKYVVTFLRRHPAVFSLLEEHAQTLLVNYCDKPLSRYAKSWFLSPDIETHLRSVIERVDSDNGVTARCFASLMDSVQSQGERDALVELATTEYRASDGYGRADDVFDGMIEPLLPTMTLAQLYRLTELSEMNRQTYDRRRAPAAHTRILDRVTDLGGALDANILPDFVASTQR